MTGTAFADVARSTAARGPPRVSVPPEHRHRKHCEENEDQTYLGDLIGIFPLPVVLGYSGRDARSHAFLQRICPFLLWRAVHP